MGRWSDNRYAKKHKLDEDYGYGVLDRIVFVGESGFLGGPTYYFKNGWPKPGGTVTINPRSGTVSGVRSTSNNPMISIFYAYVKANPPQTGWLYMVWCRRGFEYRPHIVKAKGKGAENDEVVMVSISGHHILAAREVSRDKDKDDTAILGDVIQNPGSKLRANDYDRYAEAVQSFSEIESEISVANAYSKI